MIYRSLSLILLLTFASPAAFSASDPLKSLFLFQQQMAKNGITSAMMKLGKMYENGEGIEKSNAKALIMYQQAFDSGYIKATDDIKRLSALKQTPKNINKNKQQQRQQADAEKIKNKRNKEAQAKTLQLDKQAREKAALDKKRNQQAAQARKTNAAKQAKIKASKEARIARAKKAKAAKAAKLKAARKAEAEKFAYESLGNEYEEDEETLISSEDKSTPDKGFKSDPCKSKAARYLSICK